MLRALLVLSFLLPAYTSYAETGPNSVPKTKEQQRASARQTPRKKAPIQVVDPEEEVSAEPEAAEPSYRRQAPSYSSTDYSKGQVGVELLGPGILYSFNGSFRPMRNLAINLGVSSYGVNSVNLTLLPISVSGLFGEGNSYFEVMGGAIPVFASGKVNGDDFSDRVTRTGALGQIGLGYTYWPAEGGFHFRAMMFGLFGGGAFLPWPGFNFGYAF